MTAAAFRLSLVVLICVFILAIAAGVAEENRWQEFAREHGCRVVAKKAKQVQPGSQTEISPARTVYQCDDGATYER